MDVLYRLGEATAAEVQAALPNAPGYSAVRALLRILEEKGHIRHRTEGARYVFAPAVSREAARRSALRQLLDTFFNGSAEHAVAALLDESSKRLTPEELDRLAQLVENARKEGR